MSIGVLHGQTGGAGLAVKVVWGTQKPSNAKQGVIWVNTDQKITRWTLQAGEPTEPEEGMVWVYITTGTKLNALKKNGIWFTPTSAKQYTDGAWVKKTGEYYNNGQWGTLFEATIHITYPAGSVCTATDGVTTLTAPDTSGTWDCVVPNAGTWTVKTTDGSREQTEDVVISSDGQTVDLEILYRTYLYRDGTFYNGTSLVKTWSHNDNMWSITYNADRISFWAKGQYESNTGSVYTRFSDIVDLSKAKRVTVKLFAKNDFNIYEDDENRSPFRLRINNSAYYGDNVLAKTYMRNLAANTWYTVSVDVTAIDAAYVHILSSPSGSADANFDVTEVYWE